MIDPGLQLVRGRVEYLEAMHPPRVATVWSIPSRAWLAGDAEARTVPGWRELGGAEQFLATVAGAVQLDGGQVTPLRVGCCGDSQDSIERPHHVPTARGQFICR